MDKQRFQQLYGLAENGDEAAQADLWHEFEFVFGSDPLPDFMQAPSLPVSQASCLPCEIEAVADQSIKSRKSKIENADLPQGGTPC